MNNAKVTCTDVARAAGLDLGRKSGPEQLYRCPRHDDHHPSLSVNEVKDKWFCGPCGTGGTAYKLAAFISGIDPANKTAVSGWMVDHGLLTKTAKKHKPARKPQVSETYTYRDRDGETRFEKLRYEPKGFRIRRPDGSGGFIWNLKGVDPIPYRLDEWCEGKTVFLVEGEKDADLLAGWGLPATTGPFGSSKWPEALNPHFADKNIGILPDNDEAGRKHAMAVARALLPNAKLVIVIDLPNLLAKGDVSDWADAGGTKIELIKLAKAATPLTPETLAPAEESSNGDGEPEQIRPPEYSDDAIALVFSAQFSEDLKYTPSWGWLLWDGTHFRRVPDVIALERARHVCRYFAERCDGDPAVHPSGQSRRARGLASAKTTASVERLARGDARHLTEASEWDSNLWLFNTPGGTVDLKTGILRPHSREDRITKIANATPVGDCPRWHSFLERVTAGDRDEAEEERRAIQAEGSELPETLAQQNANSLSAYLKRLAGYALVGEPREECIDFFYGPGGNGKGTFISSLQYAFGEYATTAGKETFAESKYENHPTHIAKLAGKRLVVSNEVDEGQHWDESRIKNLTGRDVMTGRFMRQDFFDFVPQFTLIIAGNHKPSLKTVDESIRRRFHLVPFNVVIPAEERDPNLKEILKAEADGILAWAVEGCLDWQREGLNPPEAVLSATAEYLGDEDTFSEWITDCCVTGPDLEEPTAFLHESFSYWKSKRGERAPGRKTFTKQLTARGFKRDRDSANRKMVGLQLTQTERQAVEDRRAAKRTDNES